MFPSRENNIHIVNRLGPLEIGRSQRRMGCLPYSHKSLKAKALVLSLRWQCLVWDSIVSSKQLDLMLSLLFSSPSSSLSVAPFGFNLSPTECWFLLYVRLRFLIDVSIIQLFNLYYCNKNYGVFLSLIHLIYQLGDLKRNLWEFARICEVSCS